MRKNLVVLGMFLLVSAMAFAYGYDRYDLERAHHMKDRGDYYGARQLFSDIARNAYDHNVKAEAAYFIGFCSVRLSDYWRAIDDYRWFLDRYDGWNSRFVPDALYVLGRTYENVRDFRAARNCYHRCIDRFPYDEFASKSRDRLRFLENYGGGNHYPNYSIMNSEQSPEVVQKLKSAPEEKLQDPFESHKLDTEKIDRVCAFIDSVNTMNGVEEAGKNLSEKDKEMNVVKDYLKLYEEKTLVAKIQEMK